VTQKKGCFGLRYLNAQLIKNQPAYEALPDALKGKLSALEILNSPFNLLKSVEALGLE
jgi:hypothetical protein